MLKENAPKVYQGVVARRAYQESKEKIPVNPVISKPAQNEDDFIKGLERDKADQSDSP